jgi:hypothetical protein
MPDGRRALKLWQHDAIANVHRTIPTAMRKRLKDRFSLIRVCCACIKNSSYAVLVSVHRFVSLEPRACRSAEDKKQASLATASLLSMQDVSCKSCFRTTCSFARRAAGPKTVSAILYSCCAFCFRRRTYDSSSGHIPRNSPRTLPILLRGNGRPMRPGSVGTRSCCSTLL